MKTHLLLSSLLFVLLLPATNAKAADVAADDNQATATSEDLYIEFEGEPNLPGSGKHIVLISGDHEYRSEEALPQLGKMLSIHHGFRCTVLFAIDPKTGLIDPEFEENIPNLESLETADAVIFGLRFRNLPDDQMKKIVDYAEAGKPMVALRTSTHPFNIPEGRKYHHLRWNNKDKGEFQGGFGQKVFGETWVSHHGHHKHESTRGIVADKAHPISRGIKDGDIWGPTDVYEVKLPLRDDGHPVILGQVVAGMNPDDPPAGERKYRNKMTNPNETMMPVAWTRTYQGGRVFVTTMGSADDLPNEGVRRMIVNGTYWALGMEDQIKPDLKVDIVGDYKPSKFGFGSAVKGLRPSDYGLTSTKANAPALIGD